MNKRYPLRGDELLLRRYDPNNLGHTVVDQGTNQRRIASGALRFDSEPDLPDVLGCSVYRDQELIRLGLARDAVLDNPRWRIAGVHVDQVRSVTRTGTQTHLSFDAIADPADVDLHPREAAHALITIPIDTSGKSKWYTSLARSFLLVLPER